MDGRGGCCIARYHAGAYDMSKVDRIMLRFRPIAPKPANSGSTSQPEVTEVSPKSGRGKKRFNNANGNSNNKRCNNGSNNRKRKVNEEKVDVAVVTLPLLAETPDRKDTPGRDSRVELLSPSRETKSVPTWLSFGNNSKEVNNDHMSISGSFGKSANRTVSLPQAMRVVIGSCVTVECVTDTWADVDGLGRTDEERRRNLERDTCPAFISDDFGRVTWTNDAYRKMAVAEEGRGGGGEVVVWLVMKDKVTVTEALGSYNRAFTCRVRVQNQKTYGNTKEKSSITVPCDVWRMDIGGFAWRLDVKAALSLGR